MCYRDALSFPERLKGDNREEIDMYQSTGVTGTCARALHVNHFYGEKVNGIHLQKCSKGGS